jgi:predicted glycoside hydrolase/deacetylase ChbG (UPF0249 family)
MTEPSQGTGVLIVNADDWGRDAATTSRTLACVRQGTVSAVSAMMFMEDSKRAAETARQWGIDAGLHLNLSAPLTAPDCPAPLMEQHNKIVGYLRRHALARIFYHPGLASAFAYVVAAQMDEYHRLYGSEPQRIDGHHHLHLCANVQRAQLLPSGTIVRRNFSFPAGEKSWLNRFYRKTLDRRLARRHRLVDFLFTLPPLQPVSRLQRIFSLARTHVVELETHPADTAEYQFLMEGEFERLLDGVRVAAHSALPQGNSVSEAAALTSHTV